LPAPPWQAGLDAAALPDGLAVDPIPAGLLVRPPGTAPPRPGDPAYAVPPDPRRALVLLGRVAPPGVARLIAALPATARTGLRLASADGHDVLRLAQVVANTLGTEVPVLTGLPLLDGSDDADARARADSGAGASGRPVLTDADGTPTWRPYLEEAACRPAADGGVSPAPRPVRWRSPLPGRPADAGPSLPLTEPWRVHVTRAGLWVGDGPVPLSAAVRPVDAARTAVDVGTPGETPDPALWRALSELLTALDPPTRERAVLHVLADHGPEDETALQRLAVRHGVSLALRPPVRALEPRPERPALPAPASTSRQTDRSTPSEPAPAPAPAPSTVLAGTPRTDRSVHHTSVPAPIVPPAIRDASRPGVSSTPPSWAAAATAPPGGPRSTPEQRAAVRKLAGDAWEEHARAVAGFAGRVGREGREDGAAGRDELVAVRLLLTAREGPFSHAALSAALARKVVPAGAAAYAACLGAGLRRLLPHRGAVARPADPDGDGWRYLARGAVFGVPGPVSALPLGSLDLTERRPLYLVWSNTGRRVGPLLGDGLGEDATEADEVVFAPGTVFRALDVRREGTRPLVLLREVPPGPAGVPEPGALDADDRAALLDLHDAFVARLPAPGAAPRPGTGTGTAATLTARAGRWTAPLDVLGAPPGVSDA
jgi:hypothetical protein